MSKVFVDTSAFLKFVNRDHPQHLSTAETFERLTKTPTYLYTSLQVLADVHEYMINFMGSSLAKTWLKTIPQSSLTIVKFTSRDEKQAFTLLLDPTNYNLIFKDALHIALIHRLDITQVVSDNPLFPQNKITLLGN